MFNLRIRNLFKEVLKFIFVVYTILLLFLYFFQESIIFMPKKLDRNFDFNLPNVKELSIDVDGAVINALHYTRENPEGIIFFLHGNEGDLSTWLTTTKFYEDVNYDLLMIDYRGYGKSTGKISSESQFYDDVEKSWNYIVEKYTNKVKIIYGRSLGTAPAASLSKKAMPDLTILVSPYYNMTEMLNSYYPWVPRFLLKYPLDTASFVESIKNSILIIHGNKDSLIPIEHSRKLVKLNKLASIEEIPDADHNDIHLFDKYEKIIIQSLHSVKENSK
jgi:pimeloyl-ACP methyl ester carboxylesterase